MYIFQCFVLCAAFSLSIGEWNEAMENVGAYEGDMVLSPAQLKQFRMVDIVTE